MLLGGDALQHGSVGDADEPGQPGLRKVDAEFS